MTTEQPIDYIVRHSDCYWLHIQGGVHKVAFCSPREVLTCSVTAEEGWLGTSHQFLREFLVIYEDKTI